MLGAIYIGLSGMNAYSRGLQTISNNVANLNTTGFKSTAVSFTDVFNYNGNGLQSSEAVPSTQFGSGVRFADPRIDFGQGDLRQSDGDLDLAIDGGGFLVLLDGDKTYYGRTGQFTVDEQGDISQVGTGYHLGVLDAAGEAKSLNIDAKRASAPVATTTIKLQGNLSSDVGSATTPVSVSNIAVHDSSGGTQSWTVKFERGTVSGNFVEWKVTVTDQALAAVGEEKTIRFINGDIDTSTSTLTIADEPPGAAPLSIALDLSGLQSYNSGATSSVKLASADGSGIGQLTTVTVEDGRIKLSYSNEKTELLGAVAIASIRDPQQLERVGDALFEQRGTTAIELRKSGEPGIGKLASRQIEASNVDLSQEFGDLILIQRGFQASSQVVSVANDMIQQLFGIRGQG
ncbi:flagellar hook protein FlgE [Sphingomonas sanxanigenens]|uniref:Flagellar hook protein FlgE n=1 Tax=Sphingomonas sanxanigenens DSM 19645 = NX02 TaxID=1123269 RepID=W0ACM5_9SPHN|nr:flagellar hook-basal body complex protein [Sphingomonas sanxanigenens]AHE55644.1 hypothetical protein NX02_19925 [Sphingomonas sanxanigenens DSM 19645 = NX02]